MAALLCPVLLRTRTCVCATRDKELRKPEGATENRNWRNDFPLNVGKCAADKGLWNIRIL